MKHEMAMSHDHNWNPRLALHLHQPNTAFTPLPNQSNNYNAHTTTSAFPYYPPLIYDSAKLCVPTK